MVSLALTAGRSGPASVPLAHVPKPLGLGHELGVANEFGVVDDLLDRAEVLVRPVECVLVLRRDQSCKLNEYVGPVTSVTR